VLAEALTGVRVIRDEAPLQVYFAHVSAEPLRIALSVLEGPLGPVVLRATAKDPNVRYASASAMLADLERCAGALLKSPPDEARTRPMQALPDLDDKRSTRSLRSREDSTDRTRNRAAPGRASGTVVMEEADAAPPPSQGTVAMAHLLGEEPTRVPLSSRGQEHLGALSSQRPVSLPTPTSYAQLPQTAGTPAVPSGAWGPLPTTGLLSAPRSSPTPSPLVAPPNSQADAVSPTTGRGLRVAVALVFALLAVFGGFALWFVLHG